MRDQLRDRRTLFTIAILPILLYPLVGTLLLQIAQFTRQQPTSICIVGTEHLSGAPPLLADSQFIPELTQPDPDTIDPVRQTAATSPDDPASPAASRWNMATFTSVELLADDSQDLTAVVADLVRSGSYDVAVIIPKGFGDSAALMDQKILAENSGAIDRPVKLQLQSQAHSQATEYAKSQSRAPMRLQLLYNIASDQSSVAKSRVESILARWRNDWTRDRLDQAGINVERLQPFKLTSTDLAPEQTRQAAFWSKLLPFVMLVWAMTGAFYPAIDLVAGEKERGTLETILCSPALRGEIVWGKLAAVTTFSMLTAILNAASMLLTSSFVFKQIGLAGAAGGGPPIVPMLWLFVALVPLSALFSALALAVAAMAKVVKKDSII